MDGKRGNVDDDDVIDLMSDEESEALHASQDTCGESKSHDDSIASIIGSRVSKGIEIVTSTARSVADSLAKTLSPFKTNPSEQARTRRPRTAKPIRYDIPQFFDGSDWFTEGCQVLFKNGDLSLFVRGGNSNSKPKDGDMKVAVALLEDDVKAFAYYIAQEDTSGAIEVESEAKDFSFIFIRLEHKKHVAQHCIIMFSESKDMKELIDRIGTFAEPYSNLKPLAKHKADEILAGLPAVGGSNKKRPKRKRGKRDESKVTDDFVKGMEKDDVLLVYPFAGDANELEQAAADLREAGARIDNNRYLNKPGDLSRSGVDGMSSAESSEEADLCRKATTAPTNDTKAPSKTEQRRHFLTVQVRDFERLCPGEFLNDTLIDFWFQWYGFCLRFAMILNFQCSPGVT